jgi:hypothetical protein
MFANQLRDAIDRSPRAELAKLSAQLWKAYAAGLVTEEQASALSAGIEARKALPALQKPIPRRLGSRPRTGASMERRRRWAASGAMPPALAARFTLGEQAVLAVVAAEHLRHGRCTLVNDHIAALAGVSRATVKRALRAGQGLGFVRIKERREAAWRNAPNVVTIVSPEWGAWLKRRRKGSFWGVGFKPDFPRLQEKKKAAELAPGRDVAAESGGSGAPRAADCGANRRRIASGAPEGASGGGRGP